MTSEADPYGTDAHPEVSEISDLTEGILEVSQAQQVRAHLADCVLCSEVHDALQEIRGALGTLPGPPRMPDHVIGRIDAALAAEALLEAQRPTPVSRETEPTEPAPVSRETDRRAANGSRHSTGRPPGSPRPGGPTRPGGPPRPGGSGQGRQARRNGRRLRALLTTAGALGALLLGGALFQGLGGDSGSPSADQSATQENHSDGSAGALASEEALERRVRALLDERPEKSPPGSSPGAGQPEDTAPLMGGPTSAPSCVRAGIDRREEPLASEEGKRYEGRPTYLVVLPHPSDPRRVDAYLVDSSCTADSDAGPGEVLVHRTYPRG